MKIHFAKFLLPVMAVLGLFGIADTFQTAEAATYYVSASRGADTNPGTQDRPWKTVSKAVKTVVAGDTVIVGAGRYVDATTSIEQIFQLRQSGTATKPITFRSVPALAAVLAARAHDKPAWANENVSYVVLDGFKVDGQLSFRHSHHVTVQNCEVINGSHQTGDTSQNYGIVFGNTSNDNIIRNNYVHSIRSSGNNQHNTAGIMLILNTNRNLIENNDVDGAGGAIYSAFGQKGGDIADNVWRRNVARNATVGFLGMGSTDETRFSRNNKFYENVVYNMSRAAFMLHHNSQRFDIYNNTAYNTEAFIDGGYMPDERQKNTGTQVWNNIVMSADSGYFRSATDANWRYLLNYADHNLFANARRIAAFASGSRSLDLASWRSATGFDTRSLQVDPGVLDVPTADFRLRANSPAKGKGKDGEDLGAYPRGGNGVGPTNGLWGGRTTQVVTTTAPQANTANAPRAATPPPATPPPAPAATPPPAPAATPPRQSAQSAPPARPIKCERRRGILFCSNR